MKETLEKMMENQNLVLDNSDLELSLSEWLSNPISLNKSDRDELSRLIFLSPAQVNAIMQHKELYGPFLSKFELQAVQGLDLNTAELLSYFVSIDERKSSDYFSLAKMIQKGTHEIILQEDRLLQKAKGFQNPVSYAGSPDHLSMRYRFSFQNKLYFGFSLEKDAGEKWNKAGDFQSFHFLYRGKGLVQTIALGDFHANFGKGLNMGTSMFNGKSSLVFQSQYYGDGFKPYRSLNESGFLRGFGIGLKKKNLSLDAWLSAAPLTASLQYDSLLLEDKIGSIALSGLHRTATELSKRNSALEQIAGLNLKYRFKTIQLGLIVNKNERCGINELFSENNLSNWKQAKHNIHEGFYGTWYFHNISLTGEYSRDANGVQSYLVNGIFPLHSKVDLMMIYRNYGQGFENNFSNAWSAQSAVGNEQGFYTAFAFRPKTNRQWNIFADLFRSSSPKYLTDLPSKGSDYFIDYLCTFSKTFQIELRYRCQQTQKNVPSENTILTTIAEEQRIQYRIQISYQFSSNWHYQFRAEKIEAQKSDANWFNGNMVYHDLSYHSNNKRWTIHGRVCLFQIGDYSARIYVLESDLRYNYSQSQLNGNGIRYYLIGSYKVNKNLELNFRLANTFLPEVQTIGSSLDQINGNQLTEVKVQLRWIIGK